MNKPKNLTLVDLLRFTAQDHLRHDEEVARYQLHILNTLSEEAQSKDAIEIIFYLAEKYHPDLKVRNKRGAKTKWSQYLNAMVAAEVEAHRGQGISVKESVWKVAQEIRWRALVKNTKDKGYELINKAYKSGKNNPSFKLAQKEYELSKQGVKLFNWDEAAKKMVEKALFKD